MPADLTIEQLQFLCSPEAAAFLSADLPADELAAQTLLRRHCTSEQAIAVVVLRHLRRRAPQKFPPPLAQNLLATETLFQQASSLRLAAYVGERLAALAGSAPLLDLCCGLGADALGMAAAGANVVGYDNSPAAVFCAAHNARAAGLETRCRFELADVTALPLPSDAVVHIDPDRRAAGRRSVSLVDCSPDGSFLRSLPGRTDAGAVKLSPMLDPQELSGFERITREYLGEEGQCRQLLLWYGRAAGEHETLATVVAGEPGSPRVISIPAGLAAPRFGPVGAFVIDADPTVIAAHALDDLAAALGLWRLDRQSVLLFGDSPIESPLGKSYRVLAQAPGRQRDIALALRALDAGTVHVKPRGVSIHTDTMQRALSGRGHRRLAVFWYRHGPGQKALLTEPC